MRGRENRKKEKRTGVRKFAGITARASMSIAAGLLMLSYLSVIVNPATLWIVSLFGLLFIPFLLLNLFLLFWAVKRRSKTVFIPLVAILPALFFIGSYFRIGSQTQPEDVSGRDTVKIVSYNVGRFMQGKNLSRTECMEKACNYLNSLDADIICLQEFYWKDDSSAKSYLKRHFKGYFLEYYILKSRRGYSGNVTLSRFPTKTKGVVKFDNSTANFSLYSDYAIGDETVRIYNCHFESYNISLSGIVHSIRHRMSETLKQTEEKMKRGITLRPKQVDKVIKHISQCTLPSVVCGDFNDNPMSYTYYRMSKGRGDSFREAGKGFGATYSHLWPLLRIDYVMYPDIYDAVSHTTPKVEFSDHYPVIAEIEM